MAIENSLPRRHHFVPRLLLKNFSSNGGTKIWSYNTKFCSIKEYPIEQVAIKDFLYEDSDTEPDGILEAELSALESDCSRLIVKILATKSLEWLSNEDRMRIATFFIVQQNRTTAALSNAQEFSTEFRKRIIDFTRAESGDDQFELPVADPKALWKEILRKSNESAHILVEKKWGLITSNHEFYISDNPAVMNNEINRVGRGNLGYKNLGIQLFLPLSDSITLFMLCPDTFKIEDKRSYAYSSEMVKISNYLQVENSERYIYSSTKNFTTAAEMVKLGQNQRPRISFS